MSFLPEQEATGPILPEEIEKESTYNLASMKFVTR